MKFIGHWPNFTAGTSAAVVLLYTYLIVDTACNTFSEASEGGFKVNFTTNTIVGEQVRKNEPFKRRVVGVNQSV